MKKIILIPILLLVYIMSVMPAAAQSPQVKKVAQSVFALTTFNDDYRCQRKAI